MFSIKNIWKYPATISPFVRNLGITTLGNSLGYLIGFFFTPFIARIYPPEAYGAFAVFNAIGMNLSLFATLNYNNALILPKKSVDLVRLFQLIIILLVIIFIISETVVIIWEDEIISFFNIHTLDNILYFLPVFIFFTGLNQSFISLSNKLADFTRFSRSKIISIIVSKSLVLGYSFIYQPAAIGLILGEFILKPINILLILSQKSKIILKRIPKIDIKGILTVARSYKNYPLFFMPATWMALIISQIPIYFLSYQYESSYAGYYAYASSLLNIPVIFFSQSLASVYIQKSSELFPDRLDSLKSISVKIFQRIFLLSAIVYGIFFGFGDIIFRILLGENWTNAGEFAMILSMGYVFFSISIPFQTLFRITHREKVYLIINLAFILLFIVFYLFKILMSDPFDVIYLYSIFLGIYSIFSFLYILSILRISGFIQMFLKYFVSTVFLFLIIWLIRQMADHFLL